MHFLLEDVEEVKVSFSVKPAACLGHTENLNYAFVKPWCSAESTQK